ncbi:hypothetical protein ACX40Y_10595 [Sphingomonas sp. RS6]
MLVDIVTMPCALAVASAPATLPSPPSHPASMVEAAIVAPNATALNVAPNATALNIRVKAISPPARLPRCNEPIEAAKHQGNGGGPASDDVKVLGVQQT